MPTTISFLNTKPTPANVEVDGASRVALANDPGSSYPVTVIFDGSSPFVSGDTNVPLGLKETMREVAIRVHDELVTFPYGAVSFRFVRNGQRKAFLSNGSIIIKGAKLRRKGGKSDTGPAKKAGTAKKAGAVKNDQAEK